CSPGRERAVKSPPFVKLKWLARQYRQRSNGRLPLAELRCESPLISRRSGGRRSARWSVPRDPERSEHVGDASAIPAAPDAPARCRHCRKAPNSDSLRRRKNESFRGPAPVEYVTDLPIGA